MSDINKKELLKILSSKASLEIKQDMEKFGLDGRKRLGIKIPDLRKIAEDTGKDHKLALKFWATGIPEVMILASMIERPGKVTVRQAERWVDCIESWDVCDQLCMNLLRKVKFKEKLIHSWHSDEREFVKRCAFVLIAVSAVHDKKRADKYFTAYFPLIKKEARDSRKYVKKAVSWALRNIAKRNKDLKRKGLKMAKSLKDQQNRSSQWISSEVIKELTSEKIQKRFE